MDYIVVEADFVLGQYVRKGSFETLNEAEKVAYDLALGWCEDEKPVKEMLNPGDNWSDVINPIFQFVTDSDFGTIVLKQNQKG